MDALLRRRAMFAGGSPIPPIPAGVVFYDRLVFDGTAYIDTDITPDADASYRVTLGNETLKASQSVFLVPASSYRIGMIYGSATNSTNRSFSIYYGSSSAVSTGKTLSFSNASYGFFLTPKRFGWPGTGYTITKGNTPPSGPLILGNNTTHTGTGYTGRMGVLRIYGSDAQNATSYDDLENYTPAYTLRPCTYNGEAGLWCDETSKFYGNSAGSGTLTVINNS